ncbi:MAG: malto-oligosyltrehalose synthase, partial [Propionibacteriaceae bacterium]|nr:malto-oligosyltrehalose synthase [Propionibacteriaceae bacterium]
MTTLAPRSTYRLQIRNSFTLHDAAQLVDYLDELGVDAVYLSPILTATRGSDHGYDTVDVTRIDPERGGEEGWQALLARARAAGLGVVVDIVPNHLGVADASQNPAWWDVLKRGRDSAYASWFDIDWSRGRILLPVLGDDVQLSVVGEELHYFDHRFPLAPGTASSGDDPGDVHDRQHYELVHWSRGDTGINYRRFFAVTTLAGVRVEDEDVFEATHAQVRKWVAEGVAGLRIDHPDGLVDPQQYLDRLRAAALDSWIVVEKILEAGEDLPRQWPVEGTTGYDAMREVNGVFIDPGAASEFTELYQRLTGDLASIADHVERGKRQVASVLLRAEVRRIAALLSSTGPSTGSGTAPSTGSGSAESSGSVEEALIEAATAMEVYRSYLPAGRAHLDRALLLAAARAPELTETLAAIAPRLHDPQDEAAKRFQQLSGAVMAKGVEDTAYYRYSRFVALNEVGGDPSQFGISMPEFHSLQRKRQLEQPYSMTALSTHDTKRGEDVRARLAVLSEIPEQWSRFAELVGSAESAARFVDEHPAYASLNRAYEYLIRQVIVGVGPIQPARIHAYLEKSIREAWDGTSWNDPNEALESAAHGL